MNPFDHLDNAVDDARRSVTALDSELPPETLPSIRDLERWVRAAFASARSLLSHDGVDSVHVLNQDISIDAEQAVALAGSQLARPDLEMYLVDEGANRIWGSFDRCLNLLPLLLRRSVNRFTENYLARVAHLHLWGFEPEVYAMSRATLDAALAELLPAERVRLALGWKDRAQVGLGVRLQLARFTHPAIMNHDLWAVASKIKDDGNDVLHTDAEHHLHFSTAIEVIAALVRVLDALPFPTPPVVIRRWPDDAPWRPEGAA